MLTVVDEYMKERLFIPWTSDLYVPSRNNQLQAMGDKVSAKKKSERAERRFQRVVKSTKDSTKDDDIYPQTFLDSLMKELKDAHLPAEEETEALF